MEYSFKDKLLRALSDCGIAGRGQGKWLADELGVTPKATSKWLTGESEPKQSRWPEIAAKLGKPNNYFYPGHSEQNVTNIEQYDTSAKLIDIPYYKEQNLIKDFDLSRTHGEVSMLTFHKDWLDKMNLKPADLVRVICRTDVIDSKIREGDIALVNTSKNGIGDVEDGKFYAINYQGEARIKRIVKRFDGSLIIKAADSRSDDEVVEPGMTDRLDIIGRVVWVGGEM